MELIAIVVVRIYEILFAILIQDRLERVLRKDFHKLRTAMINRKEFHLFATHCIYKFRIIKKLL